MDPNERSRKRYAENAEYRAKKNASSRAWYAANREKATAWEREKRRTDPEYRARKRLCDWASSWRKRGYGASIIDEYNRKFAEQNGLCAICKEKYDGRLCLDHCHLTKRLRSLLCPRCNTMLGLSRDNSTLLREAASYVDTWRAIHAAEGEFRPEPLPPKRPRRSAAAAASNKTPRTAVAASQTTAATPPSAAPAPDDDARSKGRVDRDDLRCGRARRP
jgi:Recombination endonuclease VII